MGYHYSYYKIYTFLCFSGIIYFFLFSFLSNQKNVFKQPSTNTPYNRFYNVKYHSSNELTTDSKNITSNFDMLQAPEVDIQMLDLYRQLEFKDQYGGVWTQGWDITYKENQWNSKKKLKVFVVPHSHNDPGWLNTFEDYYLRQTRHILNNMVVKLPEDKRRKFIWAEISFFKLWWDEQTEATRDTVKRLIADGQLEIVAGGWVMPDEAVSHWMAQLTQLTVGHQWLKANLDYQPTSSWAIDPFGLSPTMPYLFKNSGLENVLIQRVHYAVKKHLAKNKNLEFQWRQLWDTSGSSEILTHVMPFVSYDVRHSCGPDPNICGKFDFLRLRNTQLKPITSENVAERARILLDQYRKKSQLYKSNVVLAPLGDDFRYTSELEWDDQYNNYRALFDYMNGEKSLNVDIQFGTLTDYFNALRNDLNISQFPSLSGDFFTYSDRDNDYWSGYYTSRPFHKRLDRVLMDALRRTEIISAILWAQGHLHLVENFEERMAEARHWHSLFQHHDGITGTARDSVVIDYAKKMITALTYLADITQQSAAHLLKSAEDPTFQPELVNLTLDEIRSHHTSMDDKYVLSFSANETVKKVVVYNSVPRERTKVQTLITSTPYVKVTDRLGKLLPCQISPIWTEPMTPSKERYELSFIVTAPGFGLRTYMVHFVGNDDSLPSSVHFANITMFNVPSAASLSDVPGFLNVKSFSSAQEFSITHRGISAHFAKSGLLKSLQIGETNTAVNLEFVKYDTERSGAYLFSPSKPNPTPLYTTDNHVIHLVRGPILSRVFVQLPEVKHTYTLSNSIGSDGLGLHIANQVDVSDTHNFELVMRLSTNISSGDEFFTDLNGLNMIKRQKFSKLPTQANYYPLPAVGYIQDDNVRLTIATGQPLGAASMASGQFEIMQDRRLNQDDDRGLVQGVKDNLQTNHIFMLELEKKEISCSSSSANHPAGMLSIGGLLASEEILHPLVIMHPHSLPGNNYSYRDYFAPLNFDLPLDLTIVNCRVFLSPGGSGKSLGIVLHRQAIDTCWNDESIGLYRLSNNGEININQLFNFSQDWIINEASLTFNSVGALLTASTINLSPHQISSFLLNKS